MMEKRRSRRKIRSGLGRISFFGEGWRIGGGEGEKGESRGRGGGERGRLRMGMVEKEVEEDWEGMEEEEAELGK